MLTIQNYVKATSLEEAYALNQKKPNCVMGGMMWLRMGSRNINTIIDLSDLGLNTIEENEEEFSIGAMVSLRQLELHPGLNAYTNNAIAKSVKDIVGVQFRNTATVGGSIFGRFGFSDVLTCFLSMDTYVELYKGGIVPLETFTSMKRDRDILVRIIVKKHATSFSYMSMRIQRTDFPVLACAVSKTGNQFKAVIGARPHLAIVINDTDKILGNEVTSESATAFAAFVADNTQVGSNMRGSAEYRKHLVNVLVKRAVMEILEQQ